MNAEQIAEQLPSELLNAKVVFGLQAQGHIPTIQKMRAEGAHWFDIGRAIGWEPKTAERHYGAWCEWQLTARDQRIGELDAGWRDIESAPKDGTLIVLFEPDKPYEHQRYSLGSWAGDWTHDTHRYWRVATPGYIREAKPTHWMPLPAPPTASSPRG